MTQMNEILPPATIGILGDGQLGRMICQAAHDMGYSTLVLGPEGKGSSAGQVARHALAWDLNGEVSEKLLHLFCSKVEVVIVEWENVPVELVRRIEAKGIKVCPDSYTLYTVQDRLLEKAFAVAMGIKTTPYDLTDQQGNSNAEQFYPRIIKHRFGGYDGKGQVSLQGQEGHFAAWKELGFKPCIIERSVDFVAEASVIVARNHTGNVTLGPFLNHHEQGILKCTRVPFWVNGLDVPYSPMEHVARDMLQSALKLAEGLDVQGLLAVEFFITAKGTVIFNEMAPRPHNSGHLTIELARASQFALAILAACNRDITATGICNDDTIRPLIQVPIRPGYMLNRLGHECCVANAPPGAIVYDHDYGKKESRLGRKMGHVTVELPTQ